VGVYLASVVFPAAGRWAYEVDDGFVGRDNGQTWKCSTTHTFAAVTIGGEGSSGPAAGDPSPAAAPVEPATATADGGISDVLVVLLAAASVALAAAAGLGLARRSSARRHARA
jgi:hypothetical protein